MIDQQIYYEAIYDSHDYKDLFSRIKNLNILNDYTFFYRKAEYYYYEKKYIEAERNINKSIILIEIGIFPKCPQGSPDAIKGYIYHKIEFSKVYQLAGEIYACNEKQKESLRCYQKFLYLKEQVEDKILTKKESIIVYSFRRFNEYSLSDLINNEITVCHPSVMNDPFDSIANLWSTENNLKNICKEKQHISSYSKSFEYFRIRSFVANKDTYDEDDNILQKILMWSFYANEHKGFCIKYRLSKHFIKQEKNSEYCNLRIVPVKYEKNFSIENVKSLTTSNSYALKNDVWRYEDEVRLLSYNTKSESKFLGIPLIEDESNISRIEEITFGLLCPEDHKKVIRNIIKAYPYDIKLREMYRTDRDIYNLCIKDIE